MHCPKPKKRKSRSSNWLGNRIKRWPNWLKILIKPSMITSKIRIVGIVKTSWKFISVSIFVNFKRLICCLCKTMRLFIEADQQKNGFKRLIFLTLKWSAIFPDLNPIENVQGILVRDVYENATQYELIADFKKAILTAWSRLHINILNKLI